MKRILFLFLFYPLISNGQTALRDVALTSLNEIKSVNLADTVLKIEPRPDLGFHFPYYLRIPKGLNANETGYLLVETNNTGNNDTLSHHEKGAYLETIRNSLGSSLCTKLKIPFLVPVFPRSTTDWKIYTHAFDRDAALIREGDWKRLDLQLIAMTEHAKTVLKKSGIMVREKILLNGFSASGTFANRFTLIHPERVAGVACGGINGIPVLSIAKLGNTALKYPIGISDFEQLFGIKFNLEAYRKVPQYIYMGEKDSNDAVLFDDGYSKRERKIIFKKLGRVMMPDRFRKCETVYVQNKINSTFTIYPGIWHETDKKVFTDVIDFFTRIMADQ